MTILRAALTVSVICLLIAVAARGQAPGQPEYMLGPDDAVEINVWPQGDFTRTVTVGPDGRIGVPPLGELYVAGMTPTALASRVADQLKSYVKNPRVTVVVRTFKGKRVSMLGQVRNPGLYTLRDGARLVDAIAAAGGPTFAARLTMVHVISGEPQGARVVTVNVERILAGQDPASNVLLQPNDVVSVPGTLSDAVSELRKVAPGIQIQIQVAGQGP